MPAKRLKIQAFTLYSDMLENMFESLKDELYLLIDSGLKYDGTFAIGMMVRSEAYIRDLESTAHTFLISFLEEGNKKLGTMFSKFVVGLIISSGSDSIPSHCCFAKTVGGPNTSPR